LKIFVSSTEALSFLHPHFLQNHSKKNVLEIAGQTRLKKRIRGLKKFFFEQDTMVARKTKFEQIKNFFFEEKLLIFVPLR
jgi:hypothetical protein